MYGFPNYCEFILKIINEVNAALQTAEYSTNSSVEIESIQKVHRRQECTTHRLACNAILRNIKNDLGLILTPRSTPGLREISALFKEKYFDEPRCEYSVDKEQKL